MGGDQVNNIRTQGHVPVSKGRRVAVLLTNSQRQELFRWLIEGNPYEIDSDLEEVAQKLELNNIQPEGETTEEILEWWKQTREYTLTEKECGLISHMLSSVTAQHDASLSQLSTWKIFEKYKLEDRDMSLSSEHSDMSLCLKEETKMEKDTPLVKSNGNRELLSTDIMEKVIVDGDLSKLTPAQRMSYYNAVCESLGLNPLTRPFGYIRLEGRLTLYAHKTAADQLRKLNQVSIEIIDKQVQDDMFLVHVKASMPDGRQDEDIGVVSMKGARDDHDRVNRMMKAVTKAKRRVTLSICGLGWIDESEIETIPNVQVVAMDNQDNTQFPSLSSEESNKNGDISQPSHNDKDTSIAPVHQGYTPDENKPIRRFFAVAKEKGLLATEELKKAVATFLRETYGVESRTEMMPEQWEEATELIRQPVVQEEIRKMAEREEPIPF